MALKMASGGQSRTIRVAIVIAAIAAGWFYYSQVAKPSRQVLPTASVSSSDAFNKFKNLKAFDFKVLSDPLFKSLKIIGDSPVLPGTTGRSDIFAPF